VSEVLGGAGGGPKGLLKEGGKTNLKKMML